MTRIFDFKVAKTRVLIRMYESLIGRDGIVWLSAAEICELAEDLPSGYVQKVLESLLNESLIDYESENYSLEEEAILLVEQKLLNEEEGVPASDRLVPVNHNQPEANAISSALQALEQDVVGSNEAFLNDPKARDAAIAEVGALRRLWDSSFIRIELFKTQAQRVLTWVSEKAAAEAISEACKHLIKLILGW